MSSRDKGQGGGTENDDHGSLTTGLNTGRHESWKVRSSRAAPTGFSGVPGGSFMHRVCQACPAALYTKIC